jgi:hypothetical protein
MPRWMSRTLLTLLCTLSCAAALPAAAGAVTIGLGDNGTAVWSDPRFLALGIKNARTVVPWNVASDRSQRVYLARFRAWYAAVSRDHITPLISFGADFTNPAANYIPTVSQYGTAVKAFIHDFPKIKLYTPWNEPDFSYRKLAREPTLAAAYFNELYVLCKGCKVLAGDVYLPASGQARIDGAVATLRPWLTAYVKGLHHRPAGVALHDYTDVRSHTTSQLQIVMSLFHEPIYLDETGGILHRGHWGYSNQSATAAARDEQYLLNLAARYHQIAAIYHYQWQGVGGAGWDSGLISPTGQKRSAYAVLYRYLHPSPKQAKGSPKKAKR